MKTPDEWLEIYAKRLQSPEPLGIRELIAAVQSETIEAVMGEALLAKWKQGIMDAWRKAWHGDK